jgi:hypothetical protein
LPVEVRSSEGLGRILASRSLDAMRDELLHFLWNAKEEA